MAGTAVRIAAVLMIVVACVCLDVCEACPVCGTPSTPVYYPPKAPKTPPVYYPPRSPKAPPVYSPPKRKAHPPPPRMIEFTPPPIINFTPPPRMIEFTPPPMIKFTPPPPSTCPVSLVQLSVCTPILGDILSGTSKSCCALLGLLGVEAEICLCLAIDANILGIPINVKIDVIASIFIDCGYKVPPNLSCPS